MPRPARANLRHPSPTPMPASSGDSVRIHYTGRLDDGTVFDSSDGRAPLAFTVGSGQVIPGFDQAVEGMEPGETKTVRIPAEEAYGERRDDMVLEVPRSAFGDEAPEAGMRVQLGLDGGGSLDAAIVSVGDETVTLDANHQLAGQALTFDIELVEIGA